MGWLAERIFFAKHARDTKRENVSPSFFSRNEERKRREEGKTQIARNYWHSMLLLNARYSTTRTDHTSENQVSPEKLNK